MQPSTRASAPDGSEPDGSPTRRVLRLATRGSALARWQAEHVAGLLGVAVEFVIVDTKGDRVLDVPLHAVGGQGVFTKEVQAAVLDGRADLAVHSCKDLPSSADLAPIGLVLACMTERGDPRDGLVGSTLATLPDGGHVATGSVRRRAQLAALRPDLRFSDLRGNMQTRLEKAAGFDAIVAAVAGLDRLGEGARITEALSVDVLVPQVGQGALAVECREDDAEMRSLLAAIEHAPTRVAVDAERAFLASLGSGCDLPVGAYATFDDEPDRAGEGGGSGRGDGVGLRLTGLIASVDGSRVVRGFATGPGDDPVGLGRHLAARLLDVDGGRALLAPP